MAPGVGSQSQLTDTTEPNTILAFYCIDPFPQTISNCWFMFRIIAAYSLNNYIGVSNNSRV